MLQVKMLGQLIFSWKAKHYTCLRLLDTCAIVGELIMLGQPVADPDQGYHGLSTGQILNLKLVAELKRELSKAVTSIYSIMTITIEALSLLYQLLFLELALPRYQGSFADAEENIVQSVCILRIYLRNHYLAFLSHVAFLPSPGGSVIYRASTTLDPITSLCFIHNFGMSPGGIVSPIEIVGLER